MTALRALAVAGAAAAGASMVLLHPHQQVYFNVLEDRTTPWRIRERYDFGYYGAAFRAGLERALAERPGAGALLCGPLNGHTRNNRAILPSGDRERVAVVGPHDACDAMLSYPRRRIQEGHLGDRPIVSATWSLAAYGSSFLDMFDMDAVRAARRRMWDAATSGPPDLAARFDVRIHGGMIVYARDGCGPEDLEARFLLHIDPMYPADLPEDSRRYGFENRDFAPFGVDRMYWRTSVRPFAARRGGRCMVATALPDYAIRRIRTGQIVPGESGGWRSLWEGEIDLSGEGRR